MAAYVGMSRRIKDALVQVLSGITYDAGGGAEAAFVSVLDNTRDDMEGYPSVRVLPNNLASTTAANSQKDHTVAFALILHFELESATDVEQTTYNHMYDLSDLIINTLEHADWTGQLEQIDNTIVNWVMEVPNTRWYVAQGKAGAFLLCNIDVQVKYSRDVF